MKTHIQQLAKKIDFWNLFIGIVIGFGVGIWVMNALVPDANQLIQMYHHDRKSVTEDKTSRHGSHNAYMMTNVTSEKQFVSEMVKHHEAAVMMARQVLTLSPRAEIKKLADDIIYAQTTEIKIMNDWLASWK